MNNFKFNSPLCRSTNEGIFGNRGNKKSDRLDTRALLNKMRKKVYRLKCFKDSKFSHYKEIMRMDIQAQ